LYYTGRSTQLAEVQCYLRRCYDIPSPVSTENATKLSLKVKTLQSEALRAFGGSQKKGEREAKARGRKSRYCDVISGKTAVFQRICGCKRLICGQYLAPKVRERIS
jgi:hypothetical protein